MGFLLTLILVYTGFAAMAVRRTVRALPFIQPVLLRHAVGSFVFAVIFAPAMMGLNHAAIPFPALLLLILEALRYFFRPLEQPDTYLTSSAVMSIVVSWCIAFVLSFPIAFLRKKSDAA